jgi:hypothetical protein
MHRTKQPNLKILIRRLAPMLGELDTAIGQLSHVLGEGGGSKRPRGGGNAPGRRRRQKQRRHHRQQHQKRHRHHRGGEPNY